MKRIAAPKTNNNGIIPIFKETFISSLQSLEIGKKSLNKSSKIKTTVATDTPSGIPGIVVKESIPEGAELEEIKLISVFKTP